ncbi:methylthioribose-1-phosphate isomerase-like isoform X2 [Tigriopus californicus]|uniref:methylthioribose-1-phosphate isomerase-like isoform X2 n=1 Tax=Tigriopus californicus TaxID=6832 RepID=UPI0027DA561E|nr:methylthioribose-1-phosphate isomerase-like isoform X2 [Tigriopus californicus]
MPSSKNTLEAIRYDRSNGVLEVLDQLLLPLDHVYISVHNVDQAWTVIRNMNVRGAPAIAIVACLGLAIEIKGLLFQDKAANLDMQATVDDIKNKLSFLETSRPTAVNLKKSCDAIRGLLTNSSGKLLGEILLSIEEYAFQLFQDDFNVNKAIGKCGANAILDVPQEGSEAKSSVCVLTHCNTGSLATAGFGTALGVIRTLHELGKLERAYCTETRPYNQGARLTAYELLFEKIPSTLICDNMVGALMQTKICQFGIPLLMLHQQI